MLFLQSKQNIKDDAKLLKERLKSKPQPYISLVATLRLFVADALGQITDSSASESIQYTPSLSFLFRSSHQLKGPFENVMGHLTIPISFFSGHFGSMAKTTKLPVEIRSFR